MTSSCRPNLETFGLYFSVAARNLTISSAGTRPRSLTSMPCALAHSRTSVSVESARLRSAPRAGWPAGISADPACCADVACERFAQLLGVFGVQVDLVLGAVQPEANGTVGLGAVNIIDEDGLHFLSHGYSCSSH